MPNVWVVAFWDGMVKSSDADEWPELDFIHKVVGGDPSTVRSPFQFEYDETWEDEAGVQETVVYCNASAILLGLPPNRTTIARAINRHLGKRGPLLGNLFIMSGDEAFMALQNQLTTSEY